MKFNLRPLIAFPILCPLLLLWWILSLSTVQAAEVLEVISRYEEGRFMAHSEVVVQPPPSRVRTILTDFENLAQINESLKRVHILEHGDNDSVRMRAVTKVCILFICRNFTWIQEIRTLPSGDIVAVIEKGDFREGRVRWRLLPENGHTRLLFDAHLVPDFWFPPIIGPWLIKRKLQEEALETAQGIERVAAQA